MKFSLLKKNKPFRHTLYVALVGLLATLMTWYSHYQWVNFENLRKGVIQFSADANAHLTKFRASSGSRGTMVNDLTPIANTVQHIYDGKSILPGKGEVTKILLQKLLADLNALKEAASNGSSTDDRFEELSMGTALSLQSLIIHYQEEVKSSERFAIGFSLSSFILLLVFVVAASWFVYRFLKSLYSSYDSVEKKLKGEEARVDKLTNFIEAMSSGNYAIELKAEEDDELTSSLIAMRDKLKLNAEEGKRRNWSTTGLAQIGEILRSTTKNSADLYDQIISFVVKYTKSNQGGLFIHDEEESKDALQLVACYAFERKKFLTMQVDIGQGLVGQCFLEKEKIYLTDVPSDYIRITSGLGGENPGACLLVPLKINEKVYGVIELASFHPYENFEIELVEKFAESIASTISNVKINESTRMLLERTQQQAEEMKSQEEEMRQNMEELSATQEEMQRKEREYIQRIQELEEQHLAVEKQ